MLELQNVPGTEHQLTNGIHLIIEPGVCFDGYGRGDKASVEILELPQGGVSIIAILHTTCYKCHTEIVHRFDLGNYIPSEPRWKEETVRCRNCNVYQKKKIRYYVKDDAYEAFLCDKHIRAKP